ALKTEQDRPSQLAERAQLVDQVHRRQDRLERLHAQLTSLQAEVTAKQELLATAVTNSRRLGDRLTVLQMTAGTVPVTGSGVRITVDDAAGAASGVGGVVRDRDLQLLVNALSEAGAEAIAIDGHRLTSLTSIRFAGRAITVNYRSLTPPYVIEAIGNPDTLPARLLETEAGKVWRDLEVNLGIRFDIESTQQVTLPANPRDHLLYARPAGGRR
nr:DUF881 domain-containing protein [Propionibacteriales bacterium]